MHLVTAAILSLLANKNTASIFRGFGKPSGLRQRFVPSFPGIVEKRHAMPGRLRFRVPALTGDKEAEAKLCDKLPVLPEVAAVICDPRTGSVLVTGGPEMNGALVVAGIAKILGLEEQIESLPTSRLTQAARDFWRGLDRVLYEKSGGLITMNDAVGVFLLASSVIQIRKTRSLGLPAGFTLLWWLYRLTSEGKAGE